MKIIFLDIDGVLNTNNTVEKINIGGRNYTGIDQNLLANLKKLIEETGAKIILTSTWRAVPEALAFFKASLISVGILDSYIGCTEVLGEPRSSKERKLEIQNYVASLAQFDEFVIVDDDPIANIGLPETFILIHETIGLNQDAMNKIKEYLK